MRTKTVLLIMTSMLIVTFLSCKKDIDMTLDNDPNPILVCGTKDPLNDLKWLSDEMKLFGYYGEYGKKMNGVVLFEYKSDKVIEIQCSVCSSTNIHQYFCDGTKLNLLKPNDFNDYLKNRKEIKVLYGTKIW